MPVISVDSGIFNKELNAWGVPHNYTQLFLSKSVVKHGRVALHPFFFNDTEHLTIQRHWLAINVAFWCSGYRESESQYAQVEALASIRSVFYMAGALGMGEVKALIQEWWRKTYELHQIPAPSYSAAPVIVSYH